MTQELQKTRDEAQERRLFGVWMDASKELPPEGEYVLIHLTKDNWHDSTDPKGVYFKVAKLECGISMADREKMKAGELPDPDSHGWIMPNNRPQLVTSKRSSTYTGADEHANNLRPYQWANFGPGNYFGQEVDYWMRIPPMNTEVVVATKDHERQLWGWCEETCNLEGMLHMLVDLLEAAEPNDQTVRAHVTKPNTP